MIWSDASVRRARIGVSLACLAVAVTEAPVARAQSNGRQVVRIVASEYAFSTARRVRPGTVSLRLVNRGREPHYALLFRLREGKTLRDFHAWRQQRTAPPAWLTTLTGPAPVSAGDSTEVQLTLEPGRYVVMCGYPAPDRTQHVDRGMFSQLDVSGDAARRTPVALVARTLTLSDTAFTWDGPLSPGRWRIAVRNVGTSVKQALIVRLPEGVTIGDEQEWFDGQFRGERPGRPSGGLLRLAPGDHYVMTQHFSAGRYVVLSHVGGSWQVLPFSVPTRSRRGDVRRRFDRGREAPPLRVATATPTSIATRRGGRD